MNRREFLYTTALGLAAAAVAPAQEYDRDKRRRVGLIGCGWYGKSDLFRLVQVSPVEIVSLCDVDSQMLSNAADMSAARQRSKKRPRTYSDYRKMLAEKDLDLVPVSYTHLDVYKRQPMYWAESRSSSLCALSAKWPYISRLRAPLAAMRKTILVPCRVI